jgi:RimJ/RimL family protein N-acetyltransferase
MPKQIIHGQNDRVTEWVSRLVAEDDFGPSVAIGLEEDGQLIAGVVYNLYTKSGINMHVAAVPGKRWMTRDYLYACFAYPFLSARCHRVTGLVREDNLAAQKFDEHLGFKREGLIRMGCEDGTNMILYGMLRSECRWLEINK